MIALFFFRFVVSFLDSNTSVFMTQSSLDKILEADKLNLFSIYGTNGVKKLGVKLQPKRSYILEIHGEDHKIFTGVEIIGNNGFNKEIQFKDKAGTKINGQDDLYIKVTRFQNQNSADENDITSYAINIKSTDSFDSKESEIERGHHRNEANLVKAEESNTNPSTSTKDSSLSEKKPLSKSPKEHPIKKTASDIEIGQNKSELISIVTHAKSNANKSNDAQRHESDASKFSRDAMNGQEKHKDANIFINRAESDTSRTFSPYKSSEKSSTIFSTNETNASENVLIKSSKVRRPRDSFGFIFSYGIMPYCEESRGLHIKTLLTDGKMEAIDRLGQESVNGQFPEFYSDRIHKINGQFIQMMFPLEWFHVLEHRREDVVDFFGKKFQEIRDEPYSDLIVWKYCKVIQTHSLQNIFVI